MNMSLEDTLAALGLDDEAILCPRGRGRECFHYPQRAVEDSTLTPAQTPFALGTPRELLGHCRQGGGPISAPIRGTGTTHGRFSTPTLWAEGP